MDAEESYFDPVLNKQICIQFETAGYCKDLGLCKYYHRKKQEQLYHLDEIKLPPLPEPNVIPLPNSEFPVVQPPFIIEHKPTIIKVPRIVEVREVPIMRAPKIDLMPSLKARFKLPPAKPVPCHYCKRQCVEDNLFCNSFCGHLFCYDCVTNFKMCQECGIQIDQATSETFFQWYCKRCEKQNARKPGEKVCKDCKLEEDLYQMRLKKEQEELEKTAKDGSMHCIICMHRKKEFAVFPCAHMLYCEECINKVKQNNICFFCNTKITNSCKIFY